MEKPGYRIEILNLAPVAQTLNDTTFVEPQPEDEIPQEFIMDDFLPPEDRDGAAGGESSTRESNKPMRFVIIQRTRGNLQLEWSVAGEDAFNDVLNDIISTLTLAKSKTMRAYAWADARRGIVALKPDSRKYLEEFRAQIRSWNDTEGPNDLEFESYLIDAVARKYSLVILLRRNHRRIKAPDLPALLFDRNKCLKGQLLVVKCKHYADSDLNQNGQSRMGWRLIHLEGDEVFLASIANFPDDHRFQLGAGGVQIRGGKRAASTRAAHRKEKRQEKKSGLAPQAISHVLALASDEVMESEEEREKREHAKKGVNGKN